MDKHCAPCPQKLRNHTEYCNTKCEMGAQLRVHGEELNRLAMRGRKPKGTPSIPKKGERDKNSLKTKYKSVTLEYIESELAKGRTLISLDQEHDVPGGTFGNLYKRRLDRAGRKSKRVIRASKYDDIISYEKIKEYRKKGLTFGAIDELYGFSTNVSYAQYQRGRRNAKQND